MIIDVSCDRNGGIETCIPTTFEEPTYMIENVLHYAVDHTPSLFYKTFTVNNSELIWSFLEELISYERLTATLKASCIIENGVICDDEIIKFQRR